MPSQIFSRADSSELKLDNMLLSIHAHREKKQCLLSNHSGSFFPFFATVYIYYIYNINQFIPLQQQKSPIMLLFQAMSSDDSTSRLSNRDSRYDGAETQHRGGIKAQLYET